jgi:hypothetical protein
MFILISVLMDLPDFEHMFVHFMGNYMFGFDIGIPVQSSLGNA